MEIRLVMKTARSVSLELDDGGIYKTKEVYRILVNGDEVKTTDTVITSLYGLKPDTDYEIGVEDARGTRQGEIAFRTDYEFVTLDVRKFGAKGDGVSDDTTFIQAAIMACPPESRVLIPAGTYKITSLFLKSHIRIELAEGADKLTGVDTGFHGFRTAGHGDGTLAERFELLGREDLAHKASVAQRAEQAVVVDDDTRALLSAVLEGVERVVGIGRDVRLLRRKDAEHAAFFVNVARRDDVVILCHI